mgnify:CR=1 FL=1
MWAWTVVFGEWKGGGAFTLGQTRLAREHCVHQFTENMPSNGYTWCEEQLYMVLGTFVSWVTPKALLGVWSRMRAN